MLEQSIELSRKLKLSSNLAWALFVLGEIAFNEGNRAEARSLWEESVAISREAGDTWITGFVLANMGPRLAQEGDAGYQSGTSMLEEALAIGRKLRDRVLIAATLNNFGETARGQGDYGRALGIYQEGLAFSRETDSKFVMATNLSNMGYVLLRLGEHERARARFAEGLQDAWRKLQDHKTTVLCLIGLAGVARTMGKVERTARVVGAADALLEGSGYTLEDTDRTDYELIVSAARAQLDEEAWQKAWEEGQAMSMEEAVAYALEESPA